MQEISVNQHCTILSQNSQTLAKYRIPHMFRLANRQFSRGISTSAKRNNAPPSPQLAYSPSNSMPAYRMVDKTAQLARLLAPDPIHISGEYFLAPAMQGMGKSTCIHLLEAMAKGNRLLFTDMKVNQPDSPFRIGSAIFSVIKLDFSALFLDSDMSVTDVTRVLSWNLVQTASKNHNITVPDAFQSSPADVFFYLLTELHAKEGRQIVLLVDEHDAPVIPFLNRCPHKAEGIVTVLEALYQTVKDNPGYFYKVFVTGVSKFALSTSLFPGPSQFLPILEHSAEFSSLFGFTETEIRENYGEFIESKFQLPLDETMEILAYNFAGYRTHPGQKEELFHPWSVLNYLKSGGELGGFWDKSSMNRSDSDSINFGYNSMNMLSGFEVSQRKLFANIPANKYKDEWRQVSFQRGLSSLNAQENAQTFFGSRRLLMSLKAPNAQARLFLERGLAEFVRKRVHRSKLMREYRTSLFSGDLEKAIEKLEQMLEKAEPTNEIEFAAVVLYSLKVDDRRNCCVDISFEKYDESVRGLILFRSGNEGEYCRLLSIELHCDLESEDNDEDDEEEEFDEQDRDEEMIEYVKRTRKALQERHGVEIGQESGIILKLYRSDSGKFVVDYKSA